MINATISILIPISTAKMPARWHPSLSTLCISAVLVLGVFSPVTEGVLCTPGVKYWDEKRAKCRPCTECAPRDFALSPCQIYRDTICGSLTSVVELLVQNEDNSVREGAPSPIDWSTDVLIAEEVKNISSPGAPSTHRALVARDGYVFVVALAMAVLLICGIVVIAIAIHWRRKKRIVALIDNEEILDRLSVHRGRFSLSGRLNPTDQMKYMVDLDHELAMDRILEQRQQRTGQSAPSGSPTGYPHPPNVYVDQVILVNAPKREITS